MANNTITFAKYMEQRVEAGIKTPALTRKEADIVGIKYPLVRGWVRRYKDVIITQEQQEKLKIAFDQRRKISRSQKIERRAEKKKEKQKLDIEKALAYGWIPPDKPIAKVHRVPKHTITPRPEIKTNAFEQKTAAQKFFANSMAFVATDEFLNSFEWRKIRMQALKKYGARCMCCGATPQTGAVMNVDHIKPRKIFPDLALNLDNLQILCHDCNHGKGNWDMTDWRSLDQTSQG